MDKEDRNMSPREQKIIEILLEQESLQSSDIHEILGKRGEDVSLVTVKRALSEMVKAGILMTTGAGRATTYKISAVGRIFAEVDAKKYSFIEIKFTLLSVIFIIFENLIIMV